MTQRGVTAESKGGAQPVGSHPGKQSRGVLTGRPTRFMNEADAEQERTRRDEAFPGSGGRGSCLLR